MLIQENKPVKRERVKFDFIEKLESSLDCSESKTAKHDP